MIVLTNPQRGSWFMVSGLGLRPKQATWTRHAAAPLIIITIASSLGHAETIKLDASAAAARAVQASPRRSNAASPRSSVTPRTAARFPSSCCRSLYRGNRNRSCFPTSPRPTPPEFVCSNRSTQAAQSPPRVALRALAPAQPRRKSPGPKPT